MFLLSKLDINKVTVLSSSGFRVFPFHEGDRLSHEPVYQKMTDIFEKGLHINLIECSICCFRSETLSSVNDTLNLFSDNASD